MTIPWPDEWFPPGEEGFSLPDWDAIADRVEADCPPEDWHRVYCELGTEWMERIRGVLGGTYTIRESRNFILLSTVTDAKAAEVLRFLERIDERIRQTIPALLPDALYGKCPVIGFADEGQELSYHLARFILHGLYDGGATPRGVLDEFFLRAKYDDAGQGAALEVLGISLGECLVPLLGEGDWEPAGPVADSGDPAA
jgi:hypothetical protein